MWCLQFGGLLTTGILAFSGTWVHNFYSYLVLSLIWLVFSFWAYNMLVMCLLIYPHICLQFLSSFGRVFVLIMRHRSNSSIYQFSYSIWFSSCALLRYQNYKDCNSPHSMSMLGSLQCKNNESLTIQQSCKATRFPFLVLNTPNNPMIERVWIHGSGREMKVGKLISHFPCLFWTKNEKTFFFSLFPFTHPFYTAIFSLPGCYS